MKLNYKQYIVPYLGIKKAFNLHNIWIKFIKQICIIPKILEVDFFCKCIAKGGLYLCINM